MKEIDIILKKIYDVLKDHIGSNNPISSSEIAKIIGIKQNYDTTNPKTRVLILECAKKYKLPIASNYSGYFIINNYDEFIEYIGNLNGRIAGINERIKVVVDNYINIKE